MKVIKVYYAEGIYQCIRFAVWNRSRMWEDNVID